MADVSKIEWTDVTWNPVIGCTRVSEGCRHCYAERMANRHAHNPRTPQYHGIAEAGRWTGVVRCLPEVLEKPLHWRKPRRVFVNSMSDLFHPDVPDEFIAAVFGVMAACPQHSYQVLTKRPERMVEWFRMVARVADHRPSGQPIDALVHAAENELAAYEESDTRWRALNDAWCQATWPIPNVWLGVSVEDQATADERIPLLLQTPAAVRFVSCEPLLGAVDLGRAAGLPIYREAETVTVRLQPRDPRLPRAAQEWSRPGLGWRRHDGNMHPWLDWVIVGGESGPGARPCDVAWIRSIVEQCRAAGVSPYVKQLGAKPWDSGGSTTAGLYTHGGFRYGEVTARGEILHLRSSKGADPAEWPADLRVREYPR